jgi:hypothetical protein
VINKNTPNSVPIGSIAMSDNFNDNGNR